MDDYQPSPLEDCPDTVATIDSAIEVAEYLTWLPDKKPLQKRLHKAIEVSKKRLEIE
jgi:hypothetical protein